MTRHPVSLAIAALLLGACAAPQATAPEPKQARVAAGRECDHLEGVGQRAHDIERLLADGTGGAEDREPDHGVPALVAMASARRWGATAIAQTSIGRRRR